MAPKKNLKAKKRPVDCKINLNALEETKKCVEVQLQNMQKTLKALDEDWKQLVEIAKLEDLNIHSLAKVYSNTTANNFTLQKPEQQASSSNTCPEQLDFVNVNHKPLYLTVHEKAMLSDLPSDLEEDD